MNETKTHVIDGVTYREVERKAEVGEKVIIVAERMLGQDHKGKILTVVAVGGDFVETDGFWEDGSGLNPVQSEYRVLEPVASPSNFGGHGRLEAGQQVQPDMVEKPPHYNAGRFEVIEIIAEVTKGYDDSFVSYNVGNTQKYIARAPYKGKLVEDLKKAKRYLEYAVEHIEKRGVK